MTEPPPSQFPILNPAAWQDKQPPERQWALKDWIPARQTAYFTGLGSAGKSLLGQQLCTCVGLGLPFMGVETQQATAIYITCEDDENELQRRQAAICKALGVELSALHAKLFLVSLVGWTGTALCSFDETGTLRPSEAFRLLKTTLDRSHAQFVGLDNVAHLYGGNENIRNEVAAFVNLLNGLALEIDGSVLLLGHPNKAGAEFSGSTAWENQVRTRLFLETPDEDDRDLRVLTAPKANYAPRGSKLTFRWYRGAFVRDEDLPSDYAAEMAATIRTTGENARFLACLRTRNEQGEGRGVGPSSGPNYAPAQFEGMPEAKGLKRGSLKRAMERLFATGEIETFEHKVPGKGRTVTLIREPKTPPERTPERLPNTGPEHTRTVHPNTPPHTPYTYGNNGRGPSGAATTEDADCPF
jgi:RecA-family ATPase